MARAEDKDGQRKEERNKWRKGEDGGTEGRKEGRRGKGGKKRGREGEMELWREGKKAGRESDACPLGLSYSLSIVISVSFYSGLLPGHLSGIRPGHRHHYHCN